MHGFLYDTFISYLPNYLKIPHHILDIECGSGRDSFWFSNKLKVNVTAIDGSSELIKRNHAYYSARNVDWLYLNFEDIKPQDWQNKFTGIWACVSLLHVSFSKLPNILEDLIDIVI